ncbi:G-protein alpha subunit-domain-containing protein [Lactifluus volemus]|nr:G-protein alpha subunit-domain-containing protein [Lactifluus volemus]
MKTLASWIRSWTERRAKRRAQARSDKIDRRIGEERMTLHLQPRAEVLFIGTDTSEVSALIKHIKFAHGNGYSSKELADFRQIIWKNLLEKSRGVVQALRTFDLEPTNHANKFIHAVQELWADEIISVLLEHSSELSMDNDAAYFFVQAQRISAREYVPSTEDIFRITEKPGVGVAEIDDSLLLRFLWVNTRWNTSGWKKWMHHFEGVITIVFCASLSDYDQEVNDIDNHTLLTDSLLLFESVVNSGWFNFNAKLDKVPLDKYFPDYTGGADADTESEFIRSRFLQLNRARLRLYSYVSRASDMVNVDQSTRVIMSVVNDSIMDNYIREACLV